MVKISFNIENGLFEDLKKHAHQNKSNTNDLIESYIRIGIKNQNGINNMGNLSIADEIVEGIVLRSKQINCNPEKLVNSILYDYLKRVNEIPSTFDGDKLWNMLEHDNPKGDDTLKKLRHLGNIGWD